MTIKNGDLPASPVTVTDAFCSFANEVGGDAMGFTGLTKRELFAAMAMQGLLSNPTINAHIGITGRDNKSVTLCAIGIADSLLGELERKNG